MDTEIEIKFFVSPKAGEQLPVTLSKYKICSEKSQHLLNIYFDTPDRVLKNLRMGLRVRTIDDKSEQTIKTSGRVIGGLHQRPEYNEPLKGERPELSRFKKDIWPEEVDVGKLQTRLTPVFGNDFQRQTWLLECGDSLIEVAYDAGRIKANGAVAEICEIELELLKGHAEQLFELAEDIAELPGVRLGNVSKAQRGYALAEETSLTCKPLGLAPIKPDMAIAEVISASFQYAFSYWQHHEEIYVTQPELTVLKALKQGVNLLHQACVLYRPVLPELQNAPWLPELVWLSQQLSWVDYYGALQQLTENKGHYIRKLPEPKPVRKQLEAQLTKLPQPTDVLELIVSTRYCKLILAISRWLVLFEKQEHSIRLQAQVKLFAEKRLEESWSELRSSLFGSKELNRVGYLKHKGLLHRNLMVGACLGSNFDQQARNEFRVPWLDIVKGIEDLELHQPVHELLEQEMDDESQVSIRKWLKRKEKSLIHAMEQSRKQALTLAPYWHTEQ